jgi:alkyl sulfatase BDS1-like metallo-beta-lactamase superfamily hydrolase
MGYQAESGSWRGHYLTGAQELRHGTPDVPFSGTASPDSVRAMTLSLLFNYLGIRLNGPQAAGERLTLNLVFTDTGETAVLELRNGSLNHSLGRTDPGADATVTLDRAALDAVIVGETDLLAEAKAGTITVEPDAAPLTRFLALLDTFGLWFNIVEP